MLWECYSDDSGEIVAAGTPEQVVKEKRSHPGAFLKPVLAIRGGGKKGMQAAEWFLGQLEGADAATRSRCPIELATLPMRNWK
jgi:hypothetical protein